MCVGFSQIERKNIIEINNLLFLNIVKIRIRKYKVILFEISSNQSFKRRFKNKVRAVEL